MPPVTLSAVQLRLSVSSLCQRKDNTRRPSWFGGGRIRGCWCIDSYPLPVYESCINGWDSHYLYACLLSPTSAGKINPHPHPACFCHTHTNLSPCSLSLAYAVEIKGNDLVFMCHFRMLLSYFTTILRSGIIKQRVTLPERPLCHSWDMHESLWGFMIKNSLGKKKALDRKLFFLKVYYKVLKKLCSTITFVLRESNLWCFSLPVILHILTCWPERPLWTLRQRSRSDCEVEIRENVTEPP